MRFEAMVEVEKTRPFASVARSAFVSEVMWRFVVVAFVAVRSEKVFCPLQVLLLARSVEEAAVMVMESPRLKAVELIVPSWPEMYPAPTVVVPTICPAELVERSASVRPVR